MDEKPKAECKISCFSNTVIPLGKAPSARLSMVSTVARIAHGFSRKQDTSGTVSGSVTVEQSANVCLHGPEVLKYPV